MAALGLAYTAFAVYGSWVPLRFRPLSLDRAIERFQQIQWLTLGIGHRADWVANILLFVPLGFLWVGTLWPGHWSARALVSVIVWASASTLAVAIEFSQVYFPGRTISLNDIVAEIIGAAVGIAAWWLVGERCSSWVAGIRHEARPLAAIERILIVYVVVVVAYALLPLDLTISVTEMYGKWRRGQVNVVPFAFSEPRVADSVYSMLSEVVLWIPMGVFAARRWSLGAARAAGVVALAAFGLEILQLFVWSRTSDVNDVIAAFAGGLAGAAGVRRGLSRSAPASPAPLGAGVVMTGLLVLLWAAGAALVFLYPFDFHLDDRFIRERISRVPRVIFASYYWGSEYNAVTQVMRKMLYFLPLGAILAWGSQSWRSPVAWTLYVVGCVLLVAGAATAIELVQLGLPGKIVDPTDAMLAVIGASAGWGVVVWVARLAGRNG